MFRNVPQTKFVDISRLSGKLDRAERRTIAMDFIPYKINECLENTFYQIPKEILDSPYYKKLKSDSKLLYALLLDRLSVSMKNKWVDEDGNIFIMFSRKEAEEKLSLSDKTVTKAFKELTEVKLIHEKKQGFKKNNIIYVGKINHIPTADIMNRKIYDSRNGDSTIHESENLRPSNNKYNKNNYSNNCNSKNYSSGKYEQRHYEDGELDKLYCNF